jgi:hypothetical protein
MIFQALDDKRECVGVYADGKLHFENFPSNLTHTWRYSGSLENQDMEFAWLYAQGRPIEEVCPENLKEELESAARTMRAYKKSFDIAKIDFREHCFFDLIPHDFLVKFCELKNQVSQHVFENIEKPSNYKHLDAFQRLLHKIRYQRLNLDSADCKSLFLNSGLRKEAQKILKGPVYIDYNLFGTVTGRLSSHSNSFPVLTMKKELRALIKPHNDWFLSLDYNGAEARTLIALSGEQQPTADIHLWNMENIIKDESVDRAKAKTLFFSWLYNPDSTIFETEHYDREKILDTYYSGDYVSTVFGRNIQVDRRRALNYLIQSTTADLVLDRACAVDEFLDDKKSFISHIVHDEIVIDFCDEDRSTIQEIKEIFASNKLDVFRVNLRAGKDYFNVSELDL